MTMFGKPQEAYGVQGLYEFLSFTEVRDSGSYKPIYDLCLSVEHVRLAQARQAVLSVFKLQRLPLVILNLTTDGFIFQRPRKSITADKIQEVVQSITHGSLPKLEDHVRERLLQAEPKQKRLKTTDLFPIRGYASDDPVYRVVCPRGQVAPAR